MELDEKQRTLLQLKAALDAGDAVAMHAALRSKPLSEVAQALSQPGIPALCAFPGCPAATDNRLRWVYYQRPPGAPPGGLPEGFYCPDHYDAPLGEGRRADTYSNGILQVGAGRGFVVEATCGPFGGKARIVVTAGHCLGLVLPPSHAASYTEERTYRSILGPLGGPTEVRAECLFVDPITDIAVLAAPDSEELAEQADAYERLVAGMAPFPVADAPQEDIKKAEPGRGLALVLSLSGKWVECTVERRGHWLWTENTGIIEGGMSGSPIISPTGQAIGVVSTGSMSAGLTMHPVLVEVLPRRIGLSSI
jgi:hypothetical protein